MLLVELRFRHSHIAAPAPSGQRMFEPLHWLRLAPPPCGLDAAAWANTHTLTRAPLALTALRADFIDHGRKGEDLRLDHA